jgi:hypothetical protein
LSFSEKIIADNCKIGNIRAKCANTNSRKNWKKINSYF